MAGDVHIRCFAEIVRVEPHNGRRGVAARIDRYEFLPTRRLIFQRFLHRCIRRIIFRRTVFFRFDPISQ